MTKVDNIKYPDNFFKVNTKPSDEFGTPKEIFDMINKAIQIDGHPAFTLDACATIRNCKVKKYFTKQQNGLVQSWKGETVWCNPPYSRGNLEKWVKKAYLEAAFNDVFSVLLVPANVGTGWFHDWGSKSLVRFITGRITHEDDNRERSKFPSRHDSMTLIFDGINVIAAKPLENVDWFQESINKSLSHDVIV